MLRVWTAGQWNSQHAQQVEPHRYRQDRHQCGDQCRHLAVDPAQQSADASQHHQGTDDAAAEGEAALPGRLAIVKARQVGQRHRQQGQGTRPKTGEGAATKHQCQRQWTWIRQGALQQLFAALGQIGEQQQVHRCP